MSLDTIYYETESLLNDCLTNIKDSIVDHLESIAQDAIGRNPIGVMEPLDDRIANLANEVADKFIAEMKASMDQFNRLNKSKLKETEMKFRNRLPRR